MIDNGDGTFTDPSTGLLYDSSGTLLGTPADLGISTTTVTSTPSNPSGGAWYSNLGTLFSGIGTGFASAWQAVAGPPVRVVNPRTGQPYTQAQLTALAQQNAATGGLGLVPLLAIGLVILLVLRR